MNYDNISAEAAHLRDVYLEAEKDYVECLLQFDYIREFIVSLNREYDSSYLFKLAQNLVDRVEAGEFSDEEMEKVEKKLIVILAAIQDKILIRELVKTLDGEEELGNSRSR